MAGFFGMFDYSKPGAGVDKGGPQKKRFFLFFDIYFRKFWKLVLLNLLYIAFCIPIVTIGPATAGFTYVLRNYAREEHAFLFSDFIDAFRKNWKQSALLFVLNCACIFLIVNAFIFYWSMESTLFAIIAMGICFFLGIILLFMNYYAHLMIVTTALPFKHILKKFFLFKLYWGADQFDYHFFCCRFGWRIGIFLSLFSARYYLPSVFHGRPDRLF